MDAFPNLFWALVGIDNCLDYKGLISLSSHLLYSDLNILFLGNLLVWTAGVKYSDGLEDFWSSNFDAEIA